MSFFKELTKGFFKENPTLITALALCPTLAVTTSVKDALGMGMAATFVLIASNVIISMIKSFIPSQVRIPAYIVVIASFVTIVDLSMNAYSPDLHKSLGIFIPLIVVNCIILGRAEAFAGKNSVFLSLADGIGMGIGFSIALVIISTFRELLGVGKILGYNVMWEGFRNQPILAAILAPGAFFTFGLIIACINMIKNRK